MNRIKLIGKTVLSLIIEIVFYAILLIFFILYIPVFIFSSKYLNKALDIIKLPGIRDGE